MAQRNRLTKEEIQEDKFVEVVLQAYAFLKENLRSIIIAVGVVIVAVGGYAAYHQNQENRRAEASIALNAATEAYQNAEASLFDSAKLTEGEEALKQVQPQLQSVFQRHPNTDFADKARYQYAKTLYYQGDYAGARTQFQAIVDAPQPENQIYSLYAQKAIGNCYEQEGDYASAIAAYQPKAFQPTPRVSPEIRHYVLANAKFSQALCYEKQGELETARATYKEILDEFRSTLEAGVAQKSMERVAEAKVVIAAINEEEPFTVANAEQLEAEQRYFEAFVAYTDAIRTYKVNKDIESGLPSELRKQIGRFEKRATAMINNVQAAQRADTEGQQGTWLYNYNQVVEFEHLGLSRRLYENASLHYKRLTTAPTGEEE